MENWGSWTFGVENAHLLAEVLDKFASDKCSLDAQRKFILSSLAVLPQTLVDQLPSDTSSDDCSDVDEDFQACLPKFSNHVEPIGCCEQVTADDHDQLSCKVDPAPDTCDNDLSFLTQKPVLAIVNNGDITKLIVELLSSSDFDTQKLSALLKTEIKNRSEVSEIIGDVWSEIITDTARHGLCEALMKAGVKPQIICEHVYLPWFKTCESNLTGFIESISKLIVHFPEYACKSFLVELLRDKDSILVKHADWLAEIMKTLHQHYWCNLLSEYMKHCDNLDQYQIPILLHLIKNCPKGLNSNDTERLVALCRNAVHKHSTNRDFVSFLVSVIGIVDSVKFRPEMTAICGQLKGAFKLLIVKALNNTK